MNKWCAFLIVSSLLITAHRLPAPIQEIPESPTPAPAQSAKPKPKVAEPKAKTNSTSPSSTTAMPQGPGRFAGTWTGTISQGALGDVAISLGINATGTSVQEVNRTGTFIHPATIQGPGMTWKSGWLSDIAWTLVPNNDGKTATVTARSGFGVNGSATFRRQ
jgi:hypothetical protein